MSMWCYLMLYKWRKCREIKCILHFILLCTYHLFYVILIIPSGYKVNKNHFMFFRLIVTRKKVLCMALSEQRKEYLYEYQRNKLKRIPLDVTKEKYEQIAAAAVSTNETVNGYIKKAIDARLGAGKNLTQEGV